MLEPAGTIIKRCGGVPKVAEWLGVDRSWVLRWTHPKARGGTGGLIPAKHQADLLAQANKHGVDIGPADFFALAKPKAPKRKAA